MSFIDKIAEKLWKLFSSLKLAVSLFISLAVSTMIGSIILQRPIAQPGQLERAYSPDTIRWLDYFGFLDVFHSWWFVLQLALLALNVTIVSIDMWPRFRKRILSFEPVWNGGATHFKAELNHHHDHETLTNQLTSLIRRRFRKPTRTDQEGKIHLGAQSGRWAHLGVYLIHTGVVMVLIGGVINAKNGFEGQIPLSPGESSDFYYDRKTEGKKIPLGFQIKCLDARMERYPDGTPKAYYSDLEILEEGRIVAKKTIKVNDPLAYQGVYFYQATFGQKAAEEKASFILDVQESKTKKTKTFTTDGKSQETIEGKATFQVIDYAENVPLQVQGHNQNLGEAIKVLISERGEEPHTIWLFKNYPDFDRDMRGGKYQFVFREFKYDYRVVPITGLQVAKNPGINVTWVGCAILLTGLLATFLIPHRKLWMVVTPKEIVVAASSHRHPETFVKKVQKMIREITKTVEVTS